MPEIITRAEAKARGLKRYFTGELCPHGHLSERYVNGHGCCDCRREAYRRFVENPLWHDAKKSYYRSRYLKTRTARMAYMREYYSKNAERWKGRTREKARKIADLIAALHAEMPDLLKEFGL